MVSLEEIRDFGERKVFTTLEERYEEGKFSRELFSEMGRLGLLGMTVNEKYGGSGGTAMELADALWEFTRSGRDLGLALTWITHLALCLKSIEEFGNEEQKERYIPRLVSGELLGATAISEPQSGAHPGRLKTRASQTDSGFVLNGQKIYITNGPVADLFVVLAVTGGSGDEKEITAFMVESTSPGFEARPMDLTFVRTAPHGEILFENVFLEEASILGGIGEGHSSVSKAAFARERSAVCAAIVGLFASAANEVADRYRQKHEGMDLSGQDVGSWIHHLSALSAYRIISKDLLEYSFEDTERWRESVDLLIYLGLSYGKWAFWLGQFVTDNNLDTSFPLGLMINDTKLVMVGEGLLLKEGRKRFVR